MPPPPPAPLGNSLESPILDDATARVVNANGKRAHATPQGGPKKPRKRRKAAATTVDLNSVPAGTVAGPSVAGSSEPPAMPLPLHRFGSLTNPRTSDHSNSATSVASDVWWFIYRLPTDKEPASRPDDQPREKTPPDLKKDSTIKYYGCRFCKTYVFDIVCLAAHWLTERLVGRLGKHMRESARRSALTYRNTTWRNTVCKSSKIA